jgi:ABC-type cobalamin/Fe3+-siderophores transport system ATPase subunit
MKAGRVVAHGATGTVLRAETLGEVFGVSAEVAYNVFAGAHQVAFRKSAA